MMFRTMTLCLGGLSGLVLVAGCSAEVPTNEDVNVNAAETAVQSKSYFNANSCTGATATTRATATKLARFVFGDDSFAWPTSAACNQVKAALTDLRNSINADTTTVSHDAYTICGQGNVPTVYLTNYSPLLSSIVTRVDDNTDSCFGVGVLPYLLPYYAVDATFGGYMGMDPEPATLTADLASTQGAAASAYWSTSLNPTIAKKWNATYGACGTAVAAGEPCSTTALSSGQQAERLVQKTGTLCRCL